MTDFIYLAYSSCGELEPTNEKFLPRIGFEPGTFRLQSKIIKHCATRSYIYRALKNDRVLPECAIKIYMDQVVDVVKCL